MKQLPQPIFTLEMRVRDYEVDSEGIVNNAVYLHYMEHTRHEFCRSAGLSFRQMRQRGMSPVVRRIEAEYFTPLGLGESMTSHLAMSRRGPRFMFRQWILNEASQPVIDATVEIVNVVDGRPTRGDELAEAFTDYLP